ncbi:hypothetical protein [Paenibacillus sp. sgz500958]
MSAKKVRRAVEESLAIVPSVSVLTAQSRIQRNRHYSYEGNSKILFILM